VTLLLPLRQRLIGAALRRYREDAGFDQLDAARILDSDRSKICRIEGGERGIRLSELRTLLSEYQADDAGRDALEALARATRDGWWQQYRRVLTADYVDLLATESVAAQIMIYAPAIVPALLHAAGYARAVATAAHGATPETADAAVAAATARQQAVLRDSGTAVTVILGEELRYASRSAARTCSTPSSATSPSSAATARASPSRSCRSPPGHTTETAASRSCSSAPHCHPASSSSTARPPRRSPWIPLKR
jgi:transcriptional regulator with XRE-family HTH domain